MAIPEIVHIEDLELTVFKDDPGVSTSRSFGTDLTSRNWHSSASRIALSSASGSVGCSPEIMKNSL
jgi:hypothetical protein